MYGRIETVDHVVADRRVDVEGQRGPRSCDEGMNEGSEDVPPLPPRLKVLRHRLGHHEPGKVVDDGKEDDAGRYVEGEGVCVVGNHVDAVVSCPLIGLKEPVCNVLFHTHYRKPEKNR